MTVRKIIKIFLILIWFGVIFMFSAQNAKESLGASNKVLTKVVELYKHRDLTEEEKETITKKFTFYIRKFAHFFLYFILAFFVFILLREFVTIDYKLVFFTILICMLYATTDEIHQLFIAGRTGRIFDVLVDTTGATLSTMLSYSVMKLIESIKEQVFKKK